MTACNDFVGSFELAGVKYDHVSHYDADGRENIVTFDFAEGREIHRQIPIEYDEMFEASKSADLLVKAAFSSANGRPVGPKSRRFYVVLYRPRVT